MLRQLRVTTLFDAEMVGSGSYGVRAEAYGQASKLVQRRQRLSPTACEQSFGKLASERGNGSFRRLFQR